MTYRVIRILEYTAPTRDILQEHLDRRYVKELFKQSQGLTISEAITTIQEIPSSESLNWETEVFDRSPGSTEND